MIACFADAKSKAAVAEYVSKQLNGLYDWEKYQALGVYRGKQLIGGLIFHNWLPQRGTIEVTGAACRPDWLSRSIINKAMGYCFSELGCQMVYTCQDAQNTRVRLILQRIGAKEYVIPRFRGRETTGTIMTLTDDAWRQSPFCQEGTV